MAVAENVAVFHGWQDAITGIAEASPHDPMPLGDVADGYPRPVAGAVERLLHNGISGPYALALGGEQYQRVVETAEHGGYPLLEHLRKILEGPIVWAPGVQGAIVLSRAAATSCSNPARICRSATRATTSTSCGCTSRRVSASGSRRRRRRWC